MKIIWDLFGGSNNSVKKALMYEDVKIITFDINDQCDIKLDMTLPWYKIYDVLRKLPKPDFIFSSPLCMPFSSAHRMRGKNGETGNSVFKFVNNKLEKWSPSDYEGNPNNYSYEKAKGKAELGLNCLHNTIKAIETFKPENWYIENPYSSYMWYEVESLISGHKNKCKYLAYNGYFTKPTIFYSNKELDLKWNTKGLKPKGHIGGKGSKNCSDYVLKSSIPESLIIDIYRQFLVK